MNKQKILPSPAGLNLSVRQVISNLKTLKAASFNLHRSTLTLPLFVIFVFSFYYSSLTLQPSTFIVQRSSFNLQRSTFYLYSVICNLYSVLYPPSPFSTPTRQAFCHIFHSGAHRASDG